MSLDIPQIREHFPALQQSQVFLDNPAGTQVSRQVLDRMNHYLVSTNANQGGEFSTSRQSDAMLAEARRAAAAFYNAARPEEIVFGPNMTSLTFHLSRSLAHLLEKGDTVAVTRLDHDANISPWLRAAGDRGAGVEWVEFDVEDGTLNLDSLDAVLEHRPKIVAVGYASNALGTINPVREITERAKAAGALVFIDAVQYAPHGPIDVQDLGCDFLVSSAYKFYGPHVGVLYGRYDLLEELSAYKVRPSSPKTPGKWETGTPNLEGIAGTLGAFEYFESLGEMAGAEGSRRDKVSGAMQAVQAIEKRLSEKLLTDLESIPGVHVYGITDTSRLDERVPTVSFTAGGLHPDEIAAALGERGIAVWSGNYYALAVTERLGLEDKGGMVRVGAVHYNTMAELDRFAEAVRDIVTA